jgi:hypothetical protein
VNNVTHQTQLVYQVSEIYSKHAVSLVFFFVFKNVLQFSSSSNFFDTIGDPILQIMKYRGWNYAEFTRREAITAPLRSSLRVSTNLVLALPNFRAAQRRLYTLFRIPNWRNELERLGLRCVCR